MFTIIQDCSPYYITFTYEGLPAYTKQLQDIANQSQFKNSYNNCVAAIQEAIPSYDTDELYVNTEENLKIVIDDNPLSSLLHLDRNAAYLTTLPKVKGPIHTDEDGKLKTPVPFRINYPVFINDDKCITSWYSSAGIVKYEKLTFMADVNLSKPKKLISTHFSQDYAVLFNTTIYHDWDNTQSSNSRTMMGIRPRSESTLTFDNARKLLFGI